MLMSADGPILFVLNLQRTGKKAVELHQELEVDIVALGRLPMARLDVMAIEVDT